MDDKKPARKKRAQKSKKNVLQRRSSLCPGRHDPMVTVKTPSTLIILCITGLEPFTLKVSCIMIINLPSTLIIQCIYYGLGTIHLNK